MEVSASCLVKAIEASGMSLSVEGTELVVKPAAKLSKTQYARLRELKPQVVDYLSCRYDPRTECSEVAEEAVARLERLVRSLGAGVATPMGRGRLVFLTPH